MGLADHTPKIRRGDPCVEGRAAERGLAERLLDVPHVGAALDEVRGEAVAQRVRLDAGGEAGGPRAPVEDRKATAKPAVQDGITPLWQEPRREEDARRNERRHERARYLQARRVLRAKARLPRMPRAFSGAATGGSGVHSRGTRRALCHHSPSVDGWPPSTAREGRDALGPTWPGGSTASWPPAAAAPPSVKECPGLLVRSR
jgi:hypothetical protein